MYSQGRALYSVQDILRTLSPRENSRLNVILYVTECFETFLNKILKHKEFHSKSRIFLLHLIENHCFFTSGLQAEESRSVQFEQILLAFFILFQFPKIELFERGTCGKKFEGDGIQVTIRLHNTITTSGEDIGEAIVGKEQLKRRRKKISI